MQQANGRIYSNCYINGKFTKGVQVTIIERLKSSGKEFIRAISLSGHKIVGPAHLFKIQDQKTQTATVNPTDLMPDMTDKLNNLKQRWSKK